MPKRKCSDVDVFLGSNLSYYRKIAGLTQQQVAELLNLNRTTYTKYETGASEPSVEILKRIAETFGVEVGDLLAESAAEQDADINDIDSEKEMLRNELRIICKEVLRLIERLKNKK